MKLSVASVVAAKERQKKNIRIPLIPAGRQEPGERDARGGGGDAEGDPGPRGSSGGETGNRNRAPATTPDGLGQFALAATK